MKRINLILAFIGLAFLTCQAQTTATNQGPLISGIAPSFKAVSTTGTVNFPDDYYGKWKILFSHPADFTPVCTSELLSLAMNQEDFKKLNTALVVLSTDGLNSHLEWVRSMETILTDSSKNSKINFPIISDGDLKVSKLYGIINSDTSATSRKDIRGVYFIDTDNNIRAFLYYPTTVGRNIDEIKRILMALQTEDKNNVLIPANWQPGNDVLIPSPKSTADADKLEKSNDPKLKKVAWYLWYKKL